MTALRTEGDRRRWVEFLQAQALPLDVDCRKHKERRSHDQNAALWAVAYKTLSDATGNEADDLHVFFLGEWGGWEVVEVMGQKRRAPKRRSSKLNTADFADFYAFIQRRAAECGYFVPDPDPLYWRDAA